ncbi:MAG: hypothetical protein Q9183_000658 [Haloplaca sp. 2 TL-2023]
MEPKRWSYRAKKATNKPIDLKGHDTAIGGIKTPYGLHQNPLRSHPDVMDFCNEPASTPAKETATVRAAVKAQGIRAIHAMPKDLAEEQFARVKICGETFWITKDHRKTDASSLGSEYVVVDEKDAESLLGRDVVEDQKG